MQLLFIAVALLAATNIHAQSCDSINVAFIVDGSSSVLNRFQSHELYLVNQLSRLFGGYNRLSVTQFATSSQVEINCNAVSTQTQFESLVNGIQQIRAGTCTGCGLRTAEQEANCNDGKQTLFILFIDGVSNIPPTGTTLSAVAQDIRNKGHVIYAFGIGNLVSTEEVELITGDTTGSYYEIVPNWDDILTMEIEPLYNRMTSNICSDDVTQITQWSQWTSCSASCGTGTNTRTRTCTGSCTGVQLSENRSCNLRGCLGQWGTFGSCTVTCGGGTQTRTRACTDGTCSEELSQIVSCNTNSCTNIVLGQWSSFGACSATCGNGERFRSRTCSGDCTGVAVTDTITCNEGDCFNVGQWGSFGSCSVTCGTGTRSRVRSCTGACTGISTVDTIVCNNAACVTVGQWGAFGSCSVTCGTGTRSRVRSCTGDCTGISTVDTTSCNNGACGDVISQWGQWGGCSRSCDGGVRTRSRTCSGVCTGISLSDSEACNTQSCEGPAAFTQWGGFTVCSADCDGGVSYRTRSCLSGTTRQVSELYETVDCNVQPCSSGLSEWSGFGACLAECSYGSISPVQYRTRECLNANDCNGSPLTNTQVCNTNACDGMNLLCDDAPISFVIVMDSSSSVSIEAPGEPNSDEWGQQKTFVKQFARTLGVETNANIRLGVVNFGGKAEIVARCDDPRTNNLDLFDAMIDGLPRKLGGTAIHDALEKTTELLNGNGCGDRDGEIKAVFFLTDGKENMEFNEATKTATEDNLKAQATVFVGAVTDQIELAEVQRIASDPSLVQIVNDFKDLEALDPNDILPRLLAATGCIVNGVYGLWGNWGSCSLGCGGLGTRSRSRSCTNPTGFDATVVCTTNENIEYESCQAPDCAGSLTQWESWGECSSTCHPNNVAVKAPIRIRVRHCVGNSGAGDCNGATLLQTESCNVQVPCPAQWGQWGQYGECSASCQFNVNTPPQRTRSRTCNGGNWGASCVGNSFESIDCNVGVSCPGTLTQWSAYDACSATCHLGLLSPTHTRTRECRFATFGGNCNGETLSQTSDCNAEVPCPGDLSQWGEWGECSEQCQSDTSQDPTRTRSRTCENKSFGGDCNKAILSDEGSCNVGKGCEGTYGQWSAYGQCSEECQSNINAPPFQTRTRECLNGTFGEGCDGAASQTRNCNFQVPCQGTLTQWSAYDACSASCHLGLPSPTHTRRRECRFSTFGGNCDGQILSQTSDCNAEIPCPGDLSEWGLWGGCTESCQSNGNVPPTRERSGTCTNFSFGGDCGGVSLTDNGVCNVAVACPGVFGSWSAYGACSESCQSNENVSPVQNRTRQCSGGTFGGGCDGDSVETRTCNVRVGCQGTLTQWSAYDACSATCHLGLLSPTHTRTRECRFATFNGNCNGEILSQTSDCNAEVPCPGELTAWSDWGNCPESCQNNEQQPSVLTRFRNCINNSFGGNCFNADTEETKTCSEGIPCQGTLLDWSAWTQCSASCQLQPGQFPTRSRERSCVATSLTGNCNDASLNEVENCNENVGCPGTLTNWGEWTECSETCHSNPAMAPTKARQRFCIDFSLNGNCFDAELEEKVPCNELVICPRLGSWESWGQWAECSQTCDPGFQSRNRTCTMGFPATAGDDCEEGDGYETKVCNLGDCPVACPIKKRCNCSLATQFTTPPQLEFFQINDDQIDAVVSLMNYWTEDIQKQLCDACSIPRLTISLNTVNDHLQQVSDMRARLESIKTQLRDIINCNNNVYIGEDLWKVYDHLWARCTMLGGVNTELMACQMRFQAAVNSCEKYGWFHQFMKQVYRKW